LYCDLNTVNDSGVDPEDRLERNGENVPSTASRSALRVYRRLA
jgi:hypothetical protein